MALLNGNSRCQLKNSFLYQTHLGADEYRPTQFQPISAPRNGLYLPFSLMATACIGIILGWYYRFFSILFFLCLSNATPNGALLNDDADADKTIWVDNAVGNFVDVG